MDWENQKVIVFGGGGFLGHNIIEQLTALGCGSIRTFGRSPQPELQQKGLDVICGDLRNADAVKKACEDQTIIFHTAAKAGFWGTYKDYYEINTLGTANVIEAAKSNNIQNLVYTSSPSVAYRGSENIGNGNESLPFPAKYMAFYPETKALAEKMIRNAASETLGTVSLRPHLIWGKGDPHLLPRILKKAAAGKLMIVGDGSNIVDLTHVENAAFAHIKAAEALVERKESINGKVYFISDGAPVKLWDWLNDLFKRCGVPPLKRHISYGTAYKVGAVMEFVYRTLRLSGEPPMTRFLAGQLSHSHYFDISAAKRDLGYEPSVDQEKALSETVEYLKPFIAKK